MVTIIAKGLALPEGPVSLADGGFLVVEVLAGRLTRVGPGGELSVVCDLGGGPNGAAIGPDGHCYVCNNGGISQDDIARLRSDLPDDQLSPGEPLGRIEVVDLATGAGRVLYDHWQDQHLIAPNDLVFDGSGGFYFTDFGSLKVRQPQRSALYYALADGTAITRVADNLERANGIGLSPDDRMLYVAETSTGSIWAFPVLQPGMLATDGNTRCGGSLLFQDPALGFDSLAVDAEGHICVATLEHQSIARIAPDGCSISHFAVPGQGVTNVCFGGEDLRTAYVTASMDGLLVALEWPCSGQPLHYLNR